MIVGGAQRNNRRQKQKQSAAAAARAVSAARGTNKDLTKIIGGIVIVVVIAGAVIAGVLYTQHKNNEAAQTVIPALTVSGSTAYPATFDKSNATVLVGKPTAKVTVDAYEDFLCPICADFESTNFTEISKQLQAGTVQVRYHVINLLDSHSVPAGYSMMAANTALAVATVAPDKFIDFHYSLYQKQPQENGPGWTQAQLTSLANRLGVSGSEFNSLVDNKTYDKQIQANLDSAENNTSLYQLDSNNNKGFGTPTIVADGNVVNWQKDPTWLTDLVKAAYPAS
jgi:protein-disulfide isomerase